MGDSTTFDPDRTPEYSKEFTPEHWGVVEATGINPSPDGDLASGAEAIQKRLGDALYSPALPHVEVEEIQGVLDGVERLPQFSPLRSSTACGACEIWFR